MKTPSYRPQLVVAFLCVAVVLRGQGISDTCSSADHVFKPPYDGRSLNEILKNASHFEGSVCVYLNEGLFLLEEDDETPLSSGRISRALNLLYNDIVIEGSGPEVTTLFCEEHAGLGITGSNITLRDVSVISCGGLQDSTSFNSSNSTLSFHSALHFHKVHSLSVENIVVYSSLGTGMTLFNVDGVVTIQNSSFLTNRVEPGEKVFPGGGGVYIEFSFCYPGIVDPNCSQPYGYNSNSMYKIVNCTFAGNYATIVNDTNSTISNAFHTPNGIYHQAFARGGGLSIFFKGNATGNRFSIDHCFFKDNVALWGGGFFAEFQDRVTSNSVSITHTRFSGNNCTIISEYENSGTAGGGIRLGFIAVEPNHVSNNSLEFSYCHVERSSAMIGGGTAFYSSREVGISSPTNKIVFNDCTWSFNIGLIGAAVNLHAWPIPSEGVLPVVIFKDCSFFNNTATYLESRGYQGTAALYVDSFPVEFHGIVNFLANAGGGLAAVVTGIRVLTNSTVNFIDNSAIRGGGVQLLGYAYLRMWPNSRMHFRNNSASLYGGAIYSKYIGNSVAVYYFNCFIRPYDYYSLVKNWTFNVEFDSNCAGMYGNDIYSTTLIPCLWPYVTTSTTFSSNSVKQLFRNFTYHSGNCTTCKTSIATEGANFSPTESISPYYSGESVHVPIVTRDELDSPIPAVLLASVANREDTTVTWLTYSNGTIVLKKNDVWRHWREKNKTDTTVSFQNVGERLFKLNVKFQVQACPDGRLYHTDTEQCACGDVPIGNNSFSPYKGLVACGTDTLLIQLAHWVGHVQDGDNTVFAIGECAFGFCKENISEDGVTVAVTDGRIQNDKTCVEERTGVLCGECKNSYAPQVGDMATLYCVHCPLNNDSGGYLAGVGIYLLLEALPLILFCLFLFLFSLNVTHGLLHSLLFFSQVIPTLLQFNLDLNVLHWPPVGLLYNMWQMNLLSFFKRYVCFFPGFDSLQVIAIEVVKPLFAILLMIVTILCVRQTECCYHPCRVGWGKFRRLIRRIRQYIARDNAPLVNGFVAISILCFVKIVEISFNLLSLQTVYTTKDNKPHRLWVSDLQGSTEYMKPPHLYYLIGAIIALCLAMVLPILLLYFSIMTLVVSKWSKMGRCFAGEARLKMLLDDFYKGFKLQLTFFAPLYLFYRVLFWVIAAFAYGKSARCAFFQILLTLILGTHCLVQPFREPSHNRIETFNLLNLSLINSLALFRVFWNQSKEYSTALTMIDIIRIALAMLPAVIVMFYLLVKLGKKMKAKIRPINTPVELKDDYEPLPDRNNVNFD